MGGIPTPGDVLGWPRANCQEAIRQRAGGTRARIGKADYLIRRQAR
jgi:hypothetical protein